MKEENVKIWIDFAEEDLNSARWCFQGEKYLWMFVMCQQVIEKTLKALYVKNTNQVPEKTHNLKQLAKNIEIIDKLSEDIISFFNDLLIYYFAARYPDKKSKIDCTKENANDILQKTEEVFIWLKEKL